MRAWDAPRFYPSAPFLLLSYISCVFICSDTLLLFQPCCIALWSIFYSINPISPCSATMASTGTPSWLDVLATQRELLRLSRQKLRILIDIQSMWILITWIRHLHSACFQSCLTTWPATNLLCMTGCAIQTMKLLSSKLRKSIKTLDGLQFTHEL